MKRNLHTPNEKAKLVLEVLKGERTLNEIASEHGIHPNILSRWKNEAIAGLASIFENDVTQKRKEKKEHETEIDELYAQIGKLTTQNEWLKKKSGLWFFFDCQAITGRLVWCKYSYCWAGQPAVN